MSSEDLSMSSVGDRRRGNASAHEAQLPLFDIREMQLIKHVASGGMAKISLYSWDKPGFPSCVAKKSLFRGSLSERYRSELQNEMNILAQLHHKNIVKTFGIVETDHDLGMVMEYLEFGSYKNFFETIWHRVERTPDWEEIMWPLTTRILDEIVDAMKYLHGIKPKKVLHLDLKSDNVLLEDTLHAKICDFGLSRMSTLTMLRNSKTIELEGSASGTPAYIAPERLRDIKSKPTSKSDVYSFGILEWEILTGKIPYEDIGLYNIHVLAYHLNNENCRPDEKDVLDVYTKYVPELVDMMKRSWSNDPDDRPSFQDLHGELICMKEGIENFHKQAETSASKIVHLWRTKIAEIVHSAEKNVTERHTLSVPANRTVPNRADPTNTQQTVVQVQSSRRDDQEEQSCDNDPLILTNQESTREEDEMKKKFCSATKILVIVATIFFLCVVAGSVLIWIKTSRSENAYQACSELEPPEFGDFKCSNTYFVNSTCTCSCRDPHHIKGNSSLTCQPNKQWSHLKPTCACPPCFIGDICQYSISWETVKKILDPMTPYIPLTVNYEEETFTCSIHIHHPLPEVKWSGTCVDKKTGTSKKCRNYSSPSEAAKQAASELIRYLVSQKEYPEPCDPQDMQTGCT